MLTEPAENGPAGVVRNVIWDCDDVARTLAEEYGARLADPAVLPLLHHWNTARSSKPSGKWLKTAKTLLTPEAVGLVREILALVAAHREKTIGTATTATSWTETVFLHERTAVPVRGMVWTCELIDEPWVTPLLGDVALTCGHRDRRVGRQLRAARCSPTPPWTSWPGAAAWTSSPTGPGAGQGPQEVRAGKVARTLDAVAAQTGLSREQLLDRTVPAFGLGPDGVREEKIGDCLVRLCADGPRSASSIPPGRSSSRSRRPSARTTGAGRAQGHAEGAQAGAARRAVPARAGADRGPDLALAPGDASSSSTTRSPACTPGP